MVLAGGGFGVLLISGKSERSERCQSRGFGGVWVRGSAKSERSEHFNQRVLVSGLFGFLVHFTSIFPL